MRPAPLPSAIVVAVVMLTVIATVERAPHASAQSGPSLTATPTQNANVWTISGSGFEPQTPLRVGACPVAYQGCLAGVGFDVFAPITTDAAGSFSVELNFAGYTPPEGQEMFLVVAFPGTRGLLPTDPTVAVPASAGMDPTPTPVGCLGCPTPPAVGMGPRPAGDGGRRETPMVAVGVGALLMIAAAGALRAATRTDR